MTLAIPWEKVGVMGLGASGVAAAGFLARRGVEVTACDAKPEGDLSDEAAGLRELGVRLICGRQDAGVFEGCEIVVASPGVPPWVPPLAGARSSGIRVVAEVELAARYLRGSIIGITGSNGKSTVAALTGELLKAAGIASRVCGNFGSPLTTVVETDLVLPPSEAQQVRYVVELSSFQLEGIESLHPRVAALLNVTPDHQDRYEDFEEYHAAKARIFMNQIGDDVAVLNWDDPMTRPLAERLAARLVPFSLTQDLEDGAVLAGDRLVLRRNGVDEAIIEADRVPIRGRHNLENVLAAAAAAAYGGAGTGTMRDAILGFRGLPHRLERVAVIDGVEFYNDSKATNVGATSRAIEAFSAPIVLLMGGRDKGGDFESLRDPLRGRLRALVTFGEAGADIARRLEGVAPGTITEKSLPEAIRTAAGIARAGDVVLLAPGCASFDAYRGFEKRGEDFRARVLQMASQAGRCG